MITESICDVCKLPYKYKPARHSCCSPQCIKIKKNLEANKRWLEKELKKNDPGHNMRIERSRLYRNNDYLFKKYNACRG
jgi:hypothetical protein